MRIHDIEVHRLRVGRVHRWMATDADGAAQPDHVSTTASNYLVYELITTEGLRGIGEVSDFRGGIARLDADGLRALLLGALRDQDLTRRRAAWEAFRLALPTDLNPEFRQLLSASLDLALLDLNGKRLGVPAYELLGGRCRDKVACSWVSYLRPAALLEDEVRRKLSEGYTEFKLKAGDIELDLERARIFRRVAGDRVFLRVDASGLWEEAEAVDNIRRLAELGVQAVETPIAAASRLRGIDDPHGVGEEAALALARVRRATGVPLIEHVGDFPDGFALALVKHGAVDVFNVIPAQTGSVHRAQRLIQLAEQAGISVLLGSTVELGPGTAGSIHLAAASPAVSVPSDLVGPGFLVGDVTRVPLRYQQGALAPPEAPGLGVELDPLRLAQFAADGASPSRTGR